MAECVDAAKFAGLAVLGLGISGGLALGLRSLTEWLEQRSAAGSVGPAWGFEGCSGRSDRPITLYQPDRPDRILPAGTRFRVLSDEGEVSSNSRLLHVSLEDGSEGWVDVPPFDLSQCGLADCDRLGNGIG